MSMPSRVVFAIAATSWCLITFHVYPIFFAITFALCVCVGLLQSGRDRAGYDAARGVTPQRLTFTARQRWLAFCIYDAVFLVPLLYAVVRDYFRPPRTDEQRMIHVMALGLFALCLLGAVALYFTRPKKEA